MLSDAPSVGSEDAEAAAAADAVLFVVDFHSPVAVGAFGGEFVGEGFALDGGIKFVNVFDAIETIVSWLQIVEWFVLHVYEFSKA